MASSEDDKQQSRGMTTPLGQVWRRRLANDEVQWCQAVGVVCSWLTAPSLRALSLSSASIHSCVQDQRQKNFLKKTGILDYYVVVTRQDSSVPTILAILAWKFDNHVHKNIAY